MIRFPLIIYVSLKYLFIYFLIKLNLSRRRLEVLLRRFFEETGGSFIKFGQLLALRLDILPKRYCVELLDLFDNLKPFPYHEIERVFLYELGDKPEQIFARFDKKPLAAASFGQVHRARLKTGEEVVVKVLRPGVEQRVVIDFIVVDVLAFFADLFFRIDALPWREIADEFKEWTRSELDYRTEARNMISIKENLADQVHFIVPTVYVHLTTQRILVEDFIDGISLTSVLRQIKQGTFDYERLLSVGIDIKITPSIIVQEMLRQFLLHNFFHADPHPGNILLRPGNRIGLIDYGIVGRLEHIDKGYFVRYAHSTAKFEFRKATQYFAHVAGETMRQNILSALPASTDPQVADDIINMMAEDFGDYAHDYVLSNVENLKEMHLDYAMIIMRLLKAARKYNVKIPSELAIFLRALSMIGFLSKEMNFEFMLSEEIKDFFILYPEERFPLNAKQMPQRINRELALEKLSNWLSHLIEVDPKLYQLVKGKLNQYTHAGI